MKKYNNGLTDAQLERLAILAEEAGEVQQIIGKIIRHGYESRNPLVKNSQTNRQLLEKELGDFAHVKYLMMERGDLSARNISVAQDLKSRSVIPYLHHQDEEQ